MYLIRLDTVMIMKKELNNDVLINRKILSWEWYKDVNTYKLFTHLIYKANYEDSMYRGIKVLRGQIYTGLDLLKFETGLTMQQTRTAIKKLISTNDITSKTTNKYRLITVLNYNKYQLTNKHINKQYNKQNDQSSTSTLTPSKELKETKEVNKNNKVNTNYSLVVETWNNLEISKVFKLTDKRKKHINARIEDYGFDKLIVGIKSIKDSKFLMESKNTNWLNFDWLLNPNNFIKLVEGKYHKEFINYNTQGKHLLPTDINSDWLDDYIKNIK